MTKGAWIAVAVGGTIALVGVALGAFTDVALVNGVKCGPAWTGGDSTLLFREYMEMCSDARTSRGILAAVVAGIGVLVVVAVLIGFLAPKRSEITSPSGS